MDVDIIISSIKGNPIYLVLTIILICLSIFALVKSLYKIFIILLCITLAYFFYLDVTNDPDYENAKKEVKKDIHSAKEFDYDKKFKEVKDGAQNLFDGEEKEEKGNIDE